MLLLKYRGQDMEKRYIIGQDAGTTSVRSVVYDTVTNKIVASASQGFKQYYPHDGWVEQNAEEAYLSLVYTYKKAVSEAKIDASEILAVGLTNQRETVVAWNRKTGKPIYNAIVWQCRRTADKVEKLSKQTKKRIKELTGLVVDPYFSASKMQWIMENVLEAKKLLKENNLCLGTIDSYIAYKLTGRFVTDTTNASRTMLFNIHTLDWDDELLKLWGIKRECLAEIISSAENVGEVKAYGGVMLSSIIGDQQASLVGNGCLKSGQTKITYGTGGFMLMNAGAKQVKGTDRLLTTVAYTINGETAYALEGSIFSACSALNWARYNIKLFDKVEDTEKMAYQVEGNAGVYFVPAFTGLGAPYWLPNARGAFVGINFSANKNHMVRAILESFAYQAAAIAREMEKADIKLKSIKADGGGSKNNFILQFLADMLNLEVTRSESSECTVLGAIYLAGIANNIYTLAKIEKLAEAKKVFVPAIVKSEREKLFDGWEKAVKSCSL